MDFKDYYETLGVSPVADDKTIRQAFRQLARKVHPDVNPGNKDAEEKFKLINEAYQVLGDKEKRKKYDELRAQYQQWQQSGAGQQDFDWQNWSAARSGTGTTSSRAGTGTTSYLFIHKVLQIRAQQGCAPTSKSCYRFRSFCFHNRGAPQNHLTFGHIHENGIALMEGPGQQGI